MGIFDRKYFEKEFQHQDPWALSCSSFEHRKYLRQIDLIRSLVSAPASILEIGCAEGTHTAMLANAFPTARIVAVDISQSALCRAGNNCRHYSNVEFVEGDIDQLLANHGLPLNHYSVILQSESLYYMFLGHIARFRLGSYVRDLMNSITPGGIFVTCNGYAGITRMVVSAYFSALEAQSSTEYMNHYEEWCDSRNSKWKYEIRAFRAIFRQSNDKAIRTDAALESTKVSSGLVQADRLGH